MSENHPVISRANAVTRRLEALVGEHFEGEPLRDLAYAITCMLVNMAFAHGLTKAELIGSVAAMWDACADEPAPVSKDKPS